MHMELVDSGDQRGTEEEERSEDDVPGLLGRAAVIDKLVHVQRRIERVDIEGSALVVRDYGAERLASVSVRDVADLCAVVETSCVDHEASRSLGSDADAVRIEGVLNMTGIGGIGEECRRESQLHHHGQEHADVYGASPSPGQAQPSSLRRGSLIPKW
jgi:hypothetical protein